MWHNLKVKTADTFFDTILYSYWANIACFRKVIINIIVHTGHVWRMRANNNLLVMLRCQVTVSIYLKARKSAPLYSSPRLITFKSVATPIIFIPELSD